MQLNPSKSSSEDDGSASRVFKRCDLPRSPAASADIRVISRAHVPTCPNRQPTPTASLIRYKLSDEKQFGSLFFDEKAHEDGDKMPPAPPEDGGPRASLDRLKAQAAPPHPEAPPEPRGGSLWPRSLASSRPKAEDFHTFILPPQEKLLALLKHFLSKSGKYAVQVRRVISP